MKEMSLLPTSPAEGSLVDMPRETTLASPEGDDAHSCIGENSWKENGDQHSSCSGKKTRKKKKKTIVVSKHFLSNGHKPTSIGYSFFLTASLSRHYLKSEEF